MKKIRTIFKVGILLTVALAITGCATIISTSRQDVTVSSNPSQAEVVVKDQMGRQFYSGKTPSTINLERKNSYVITMTLPGYRPAEIYIDKQFNVLFCGNLICGGLIGIIIDAVTGAMYKLEPNTVHIELVSAQQASLQGTEVYAQIHTMDSEGQIRKAYIPLIAA